jgi:Bacterial SH3 domain
MTPSGPSRRLQISAALASLVLLLPAVSCLTSPTRRSTAGQESPSQAMARRDTAIQELQKEVQQQNSHLDEKDAQIKQLEEWLLSQQRMLDDAIQEVVRVKAKQRSMESRAEAASEMAEAEIALKSLRDKAGDSNPPEIANAEQLLGRASKEFDSQNFGGALYLVGQTKTQIKMGMLRLAGRDRAEGMQGREDEMPFAVPLPLKLNARGNLREGPGPEFKIVATLDQGTALTGYFTKGAWLRVESASGSSGWIHRSLVSPN